MKQLKVFICIVILLYISIYPVLATNFGNPLFQSDAMEQAEIRTNETLEKFRNGLLPACSVSWFIAFVALVLAAIFLGYYCGLSSGCVINPIMWIIAYIPMCVSFILGSQGVIIVGIVTAISIFIGALNAI